MYLSLCVSIITWIKIPFLSSSLTFLCLQTHTKKKKLENDSTGKIPRDGGDATTTVGADACARIRHGCDLVGSSLRSHMRGWPCRRRTLRLAPAVYYRRKFSVGEQRPEKESSPVSPKIHFHRGGINLRHRRRRRWRFD